MKKVTKILAGAIAIGGAFLQRQDVQDAIIAFVKAHPHSTLGAATVAVLGILLHDPKSDPQPQIAKQ